MISATYIHLCDCIGEFSGLNRDLRKAPTTLYAEYKKFAIRNIFAEAVEIVVSKNITKRDLLDEVEISLREQRTAEVRGDLEEVRNLSAVMHFLRCLASRVY